MVTAGDVSITQDGGQPNAKLHPYLVALVRWCVSCVWGPVAVILHRVTAPLPPITAGKQMKSRLPCMDHIHPEPRVECVVLHQPPEPRLDVIFFHGLYGSLANTWRQGDWRSKYKLELNKVPLRRSSSIPIPCECSQCDSKLNTKKHHTDFDNELTLFDKEVVTFRNIDENFYKGIEKVSPDDKVLMKEKFYSQTLLDHVKIVDNFDTQDEFIRDLFEANETATFKSEHNEKINYNKCECRGSGAKTCEIGCGCICEDCYSPCWPKDWIKVDYPDARVISVNYTSDPYLWRPLWVKETKRLRLHERAEQMTQQLIKLGVGSKPIIWVGHSKGGLFIKQIYCEAYEAYLKLGKNQSIDIEKQTCPKSTVYNEKNNLNESEGSSYNNKQKPSEVVHCKEIVKDVAIVQADAAESGQIFENNEENFNSINISEIEEHADLWRNSAGFMFYSVPHRGSPLADFKTPITARSIELLEISKDCALVLSLQDRWLRATSSSQPVVRSLVETCRTLMSILWLRIVSVDSADAGIGALCGVSVDHREICKPSSRRCLLYTELTNLINTAINKCRCP